MAKQLAILITLFLATLAPGEPSFLQSHGAIPTSGKALDAAPVAPAPTSAAFSTLAGVASDYRPASGEGSTAERLVGFSPQFRSTAENVMKGYTAESEYSTAASVMDASAGSSRAQ